MLVYLQKNYNYPSLFRQTPGSSGKWKEMQFTFENVDAADAIIVINHPINDIKMQCRKGNKLLFIHEPPYERNNYLKLHFRFYDSVISGFEPLKGMHMLNRPASLPWHVNKTYDELMNLSIDESVNKLDKLSFVTSNSNIHPQHKIRLDFIEYLKNRVFDFDLFGRGFQPIEDKFQGIFPYKYTVAAENYIANDYFTEKIMDAFLCYSMPVYYGCTNISDYFPSESMILIDINNPEEALEKIKEAIANKKWNKNKDAIQHSRELVLNKYQFFPSVYELLKENSVTQNAPFEKVYIPHSGLTGIEQAKKKIKKIFGAK